MGLKKQKTNTDAYTVSFKSFSYLDFCRVEQCQLLQSSNCLLSLTRKNKFAQRTLKLERAHEELV